LRANLGMHFPPFDWHPARRQLRYFAWLTALFLAVLSWAGGTSLWTLYLRLAAAFLFALGTVLPGILRWPYVALLFILYVLGRLCNRILRPLAPQRDRKKEPKRFPQPHDRQPATGTHG
jgi:hypothetical protein